MAMTLDEAKKYAEDYLTESEEEVQVYQLVGTMKTNYTTEWSPAE